MNEKQEGKPMHYLRGSKSREHLATFHGQVPRAGEVVWMEPEGKGEVLEYRVVRVEWQVQDGSAMYARVYVEPLMDRP